MDKSINRYIKLYPWYAGFTGDLLFYIAIDTLFLTVVKNFSAAEIVSITSLSQLFCILLQFPVLFVIKKIGNTASVRTGAVFMLLSAIFITLGKSYYLVLVGRLFHDVSTVFRTAAIVALENNLDMVDRRSDFVRMRTSANTVYSVLTMLIAFVASFMFNLNHYLPMVGCITTCTIGVILSLFMKDSSEYNKISYKKSSRTRVKIQYNKVIILAIVLFAFLYSVVNNGQSDSKLFIQQNVLLGFDIEATALIIGAIVCVSRIIRVLSNVVFVKLYTKYQAKMGVIMPTLLALSLGSLLFGSFITSVVIKILVMGLGYTVILFIRDPFKLYIQDVVFSNSKKEYHQTLITVLEFGVKIVTTGLGLVFSVILLNYPMVWVIAIMFVIAIIQIIIGTLLYRVICVGKEDIDSGLRI